MLQVHRSDRTEVLVDALAEVVHGAPLRDPMATEVVLVGSAGMARWLEGRLARLSPYGVCAGLETMFPGSFTSSVAATVLDEDPPATDPWSRGLLAWGVADALPDLLETHPPGPDDPWAAVRRYVVRDDRDVGDMPVTRRLLALSGDIADRFDRYALHRPALLTAWREGQDVDAVGGRLEQHRWQALLWRQLADQRPVRSPAERVDAAVQRLVAGDVPDGLPERVSVFGLSTLPRLHLALLAALARDRRVDLYVPSPSAAAWQAGLGDVAAPATTVLLRAAGPVARDTARLVADAAAAAGIGVEDRLLPAGVHDAAPVPGSVLDRLRRTVVEAVAPDVVPPRATGDDTVALHACRGPLRQVEVLRDELRRRFDADPTLQPRDVVVLTPDLATFGPLADAVLTADPGGSPDAPPALPVAVADRAPGAGNQLAVALLRAVRLVTGRVTAAEVLDLLTTEPVLAHHRIDPVDVGRVERWIDEVGVVWARDADDREVAGQPSSVHGTWQQGLDRLLLGIALPGDDHRTVAGLTPYPHVEDAGDLDLLEHLVVLLGTVDRLRELRTPRGAGRWLSDLRALLDDLTGPATGRPGSDDAERTAHRRAREAVEAALRGLEHPADFAGRDIEVDALLTWLERALGAPASGAAGFATGAITVAGLVPLRAVPFRVVCLLGMDEGSFPRPTRRSHDDLLAADRRPGDDDPRAEDRHAFVEAVLAARDALVVTWTGFDPRRGDRRRPAGPVVDLFDALGTVVAGGAAACTTEHPVLPTSPLAFAVGRPPAYDADRHAAAEVASRPAGQLPPFVPRTLQPLGDATADIDLDRVLRAVRSPQSTLLQRLGTSTYDDLRVLPSVEQVQLSARDTSMVGGALLEGLLGGQDHATTARALAASGVVPAGTPGELVLADVGTLAARLAWLGGAGRPQVLQTIDVDLGARRLVGRLVVDLDDDVAVLRESRYARPGPARRLAAWVRHLAANAAGERPVRSVLAGRPAKGHGDDPSVDVLLPVDPGVAHDHLVPWLALHDRLRCEAVPFLPAVSWAWVTHRRAGKADDEVVRQARNAYEPLEDEDFRAWVALDDPAVRLVFRDKPDFATLLGTTDFAELAERLVWPAQDAYQEGRDEAQRLATEALAIGGVA